MYRIGLIGQPNAGKTTIFNLLTGANALIANYPFSTVDPNKATIKIYDKQLLDLKRALGAKNTLLPEVEVWDIAGLIAGASKGEGLGNEFLGHIKDCDLLIHVLRDKAGLASLAEQAQIVDKEVAYFDHKLLQKPFEKGRRMAHQYPKEKKYVVEDEIISRAYYGSKSGKLIADTLTKEDLESLQYIGLISTKPYIFFVNTDKPPKDTKTTPTLGADAAVINALDYLSLIDLTDEEAEIMGYSRQVINTLIVWLTEEVIKLTKSKRFYTVGHLGVGFWVIEASQNASECARLLHTDLDENIKAVRVANIDAFIENKDWSELTAKGLVKKFGPSYVPKDKDVLFFDQ